MRTLLIILTLLGYSCLSHSQTIEKFSIDSGGVSTTAGGIQILYTIGEVNVQELNSGGIYISEGFINGFEDNTLGVSEVDTTNLSIYPNPASEYITIESNKALDAIEFYDVLGKPVLQTLDSRIDISALSAGIYIVKLSMGNKSISKKIVVQ
ncbi:T9SS type A sorting domain-containing protein [Winogradskyella pulchriflava]|uniref:T9SS type A sorting domain-containing protein n=1 Tax=Winogradskyella pulchriflava TaxID=1110688 RepID=A0ABV6Q5R4_9FLAO